MLEDLTVLSHTENVFRLANPRDDVRALEALGLGRSSIDEMLELLRSRAASGGLERIIDASFEPWNKFGPPYGSCTRFSDGTWPVCYTARDQETAEDEVRYHRGKDLFSAAPPRTVYYNLIELSYAGSTIDLCPQSDAWPELVEKDETRAYPFCQKLGREAHEKGMDGFLTRSARRSGGTSVPVFGRSALTEPEIRAVAAFVVDPVSGTLQVNWG